MVYIFCIIMLSIEPFGHKILTVLDDSVLVSGNQSLWTWESRSQRNSTTGERFCKSEYITRKFIYCICVCQRLQFWTDSQKIFETPSFDETIEWYYKSKQSMECSSLFSWLTRYSYGFIFIMFIMIQSLSNIEIKDKSLEPYNNFLAHKVF